MKILFLTSRLPYPPHRGDKLRSWNFIKYLARKHDVYLLSFIQDESERQFLPRLNEICRGVTVVHLPLWRSVINCVKAIFAAKPFQVAYYESRKMTIEFQRTIERFQPDIVHAHLIRMAPYVGRTNGASILDLSDAVSLYLRRFKKSQKSIFFRFLIGTELLRVERFERVLLQFDGAIMCSSVDAGFMQERIKNGKISIVNNGVDLNGLTSPRQLLPDPVRIIFSGNMSYYPNADGARYFASEIFPKIREEIPHAQLFIVGQEPPRSVRSLSSSDISVTGFVADIHAEYLKSAVAVSPLRFGAGTPYKVLEPMALGVPVVATSVGVEGLDFREGKEILISDDPISFAENVIYLLKNPSERAKIGRAAKRAVLRNHAIDVIGNHLIRVYRQALAKKFR